MKKNNIGISSLKQVIIRLAEIGIDEEKMMHVTGINKSDFEELKEDKMIKSALKKYTGLNERLVEEALLKCAVGFEYDEVTLTPASAKSGKDQGSVPSQKVTRKTVLPNATACMFWLKNRMPERWRDPKDISDKEILKESIKAFGKE